MLLSVSRRSNLSAERISRYFSYLCGLLLLFCFGCAASCHSEPGSPAAKSPIGKKESTVKVYSRIWADLRQSSFLQVTSQATGRKVWFSPTNTAPTLLLVDKDGITAQFDDHLQRLNLQGAALWSKERDGSMTVFSHNGEILYRGADSFLHATSSEGKERLDEYFIPRVRPLGGVNLILPLGQDNYLMQIFNRPEEFEHGVPPGKNDYQILVRGPESYNDIKWNLEFVGIALPGLVTADGKRLVILNQDDQILVFEIATGKQLSTATVEGAGFVCASLDQSDNVIVYCWDAEDKKSIRSLTLQGKSNWVHPLGSREARFTSQPPALGADGTVYAVVNDSLMALANGDVKWIDQLLPAQLQYLTLLDGGLLAISGNEMKGLDNNGKERLVFRLPPEETITTPPVVDGSGRIFIGTTKGIYCVN
jgi:hypothetical protein